MVCRDSCVEFFGLPDPARGGYFNFEANCCGCVHLGFGPGRPDRRLATPDVFAKIQVATSIPTKTRSESARDDGWWLAAALTYEGLSELADARVAPKSGDVWKANFFRCGGKTDPQYAVWNPIDREIPDYHRPEFFGELRFE